MLHVLRFAGLLAIASLSMSAVRARGEIRVACYSDGNECEVTQDLAKRFEAQNTDVKVVIDKVPVQGDPRAAAGAARRRRRARTSRASPIWAGCRSTTSTSRRT